MKKVILIVVLGLLWCNVGFAEKIESLNNMTFQLPEGFLFINKLTIDKLIVSAETKQFKDLYLQIKSTLGEGTLEYIFDKELFQNGKFDNITISSSATRLAELKDVANNEKAICAVKLAHLKSLNGDDKIKSHKCAVIKYPKGAAWSVQEFHENLNNQMKNAYAVTFKISESSKKIHSIIITCGQYCNKYLPAFNEIIGSAILD